jgi:predicted RNA-binding Zn ribbon-like protein
VTSLPVIPRQPLAVHFMNTIWADRDGVHDTLADRAGLTQWLSAAMASGAALGGPVLGAAVLDSAVLDGAVLDGAVLIRFRALRDAVRLLAAEITGDARMEAGPLARDVAGAIRTVNRSCAAAPSWSELGWRRSGAPRRQVVTAAAPADSVLARLAEAAAELFGSGHAGELAACLAPGCVLYFLRDHPRRQWCSDGCGNRARVARHYARHRAPSRPAGAAGSGPQVG